MSVLLNPVDANNTIELAARASDPSCESAPNSPAPHAPRPSAATGNTWSAVRQKLPDFGRHAGPTTDTETVNIAGPPCTPLDLLGKDVQPPVGEVSVMIGRRYAPKARAAIVYWGGMEWAGDLCALDTRQE